MKINISKIQQIKTILASSKSGLDGWNERYLPPGKNTKDFKYEEIFTINEQDVYSFVIANGWDERVVLYVEKLPDPKNPESMFYDYMILPFDSGKYKLVHFGSYDRQLWLHWDFTSQEELFRFIIQELFKIQRCFWKY